VEAYFDKFQDEIEMAENFYIIGNTFRSWPGTPSIPATRMRPPPGRYWTTVAADTTDTGAFRYHAGGQHGADSLREQSGTLFPGFFKVLLRPAPEGFEEAARQFISPIFFKQDRERPDMV